MKNFTLIACLTLGLISCSNTGYEKKILGSWCEPIPGRAQDVQGIKPVRSIWPLFNTKAGR